ncbi:MAG: hypothetical protein JWO76_1197 [Nocardioides sp.]|nr:hypothetical protein [Nocardioides sp.]
MTVQPTQPASVADLARAYAEARDAETLRQLRSAVRRSGTYRVDLDVLAAAAPLLDRGAHAEVVALVRDLMPGAFFSPSAHAVLGAAYEAMGDDVRAHRERRTSRLALASILGTGDGSADRPWSVLRISDEYDVLRAQDRTSREQLLVTRNGRELDQHRCDDGTDAWFDIALLRGDHT